MIRTLSMLALVAAAALAGCDQTDHTINGNAPDDPQANAANSAAAAPIKLPPSIVASHPYRCKDNSLVSIDWLSDGSANSARVSPEGGAAVTLIQAEAGAAYTAEGASLTGDPKGKAITYNGKSCSR